MLRAVHLAIWPFGNLSNHIAPSVHAKPNYTSRMSTPTPAPTPPPNSIRFTPWTLLALALVIAAGLFGYLSNSLSPTDQIRAAIQLPVAIAVSLLIGAIAAAIARKSGRAQAAFDTTSRIVLFLFFLAQVAFLVMALKAPAPNSQPPAAKTNTAQH